jgi:hypothetical protein
VTYLGVSVRVWLSWAVLSVAISVAALSWGLFGEPHCGYVADSGGEMIEASCYSLEELEERVAEIHRTQSGQRNWGGGL